MKYSKKNIEMKSMLLKTCSHNYNFPRSEHVKLKKQKKITFFLF